jgi:hypothetical protein
MSKRWFCFHVVFWFVAVLALGQAVFGAQRTIEPGQLCEKGERYETYFDAQGGFHAMCYTGDLDEARAAVEADESRPSFTAREGGCMTCSLDEDLKIEALILLRRLNDER